MPLVWPSILTMIYKSSLILMHSGKENVNKGALLPEDFNGSLEDYISLIYDHQKLCQKEGKYI